MQTTIFAMIWFLSWQKNLVKCQQRHHIFIHNYTNSISHFRTPSKNNQSRNTTYNIIGNLQRRLQVGGSFFYFTTTNFNLLIQIIWYSFYRLSQHDFCKFHIFSYLIFSFGYSILSKIVFCIVLCREKFISSIVLFKLSWHNLQMLIVQDISI